MSSIKRVQLKLLIEKLKELELITALNVKLSAEERKILNLKITQIIKMLKTSNI